MVLLSSFVLTLASFQLVRCGNEIVQWTGGPFEWTCKELENVFKSDGRYIEKNIMAVRGVIYEDQAILALPRYKSGVPATLAKIQLDKKSCHASLIPFPCLSLQEEGACTALQNVVDVFLDSNNLLWVLDTGIVNNMEEPIRKCPPKAVSIDMKTGNVIRVLDLGSLSSEKSRLQYISSDISAQGKVHLYITDAATKSIIVYNVNSETGHVVSLPPDVSSGSDCCDVLYSALIRLPDGENRIYLTYLSSDRIFSIDTKSLRKSSNEEPGKIRDCGTKGKRIVILGTDNGSALFFRYEGDSDVYRWDTMDCYSPANFQKVYLGDECLLPTQVIPDYKLNRIRVLESSFPDFFSGTVGCGVDQALVVI